VSALTTAERLVGDTGQVSTPAPARRSPVVALGVVAALLAAACVALLVVGNRHEGARDDLASARAAAVAAAQQEIVNLDSISVKTVDADIKRVVDGATGTFKELFTKAQGDLKQVFLERQSTSKARIRSAGLVRGDLDTATVLVAVDRTLSDKTRPDGVVQAERWTLELEKHNGRWLVSKLEPVS
jgi:Mce-associated membrane protein